MPESGSGLPWTIASCAVSLDGYLDDASGTRLLLSNADDLDRVDGVRASCDAILVGAGTIRRDDSRLRVKDPRRRRAREAAGLPETPLRATLTASGHLPADAAFLADDGRALVLAASGGVDSARSAVADRAEVVDLGPSPRLRDATAALGDRGVRRLMVEGGSRLLHGVLAEGVADELHLAIAPVLVGDARAPRFCGAADRPDRAALARVTRLGEVVVLEYLLSDRAQGRSGS